MTHRPPLPPPPPPPPPPPHPAESDVRAAVRAVLADGPRTAEEIVAGIPSVTGGVWHPRSASVLPVLAAMHDDGEVTRDGRRYRRTEPPTRT